MKNRSIVLLALGLMLGGGTLRAQDTGGSLPELEVENITVIGNRVIVLPTARKGEVTDTSLFVLPLGDTLMFGERISNLAGPGGALPAYREFVAPAKLGGEVSIGSYLSPRAIVHGEYTQRRYGVTGTVDYRGTQGHVDGAEAGSLLIGAQGNLLIGGDSPVPVSRLSAGFERISESYTLYGNAIPVDRARAMTRISAGLASHEDGPFEYDVDLVIDHTSVDDGLDTAAAASVTALTPGFGFGVGARVDSVHGRIRLDYAPTSLRYSSPTPAPSYFSMSGELEWHPAARVQIIGGLFYANGGHSDSLSSSLVMPRVAVRLGLSDAISLFAWFAPELRAPSYRDRLMRAPYVNPEITLRPERVPVSFAGGLRWSTEGLTIEGRGFYESATNTPVVTGDTVNGLRYEHVDSRTIGALGSVTMWVLNSLSVQGDLIVRSAVNTATDLELPMTPAMDIRGRADLTVTEELEVFGAVTFQSAQRTSLDSTGLTEDLQTIPARFLIDAGASYRFLPSVEGFVEVTNLLNYQHDLWLRYSAPGLEGRVGVRMKF